MKKKNPRVPDVNRGIALSTIPNINNNMFSSNTRFQIIWIFYIMSRNIIIYIINYLLVRMFIVLYNIVHNVRWVVVVRCRAHDDGREWKTDVFPTSFLNVYLKCFVKRILFVCHLKKWPARIYLIEYIQSVVFV